MIKKLNWKVTKPCSGKRLDLALVDAKLGLSRRKIRSIIDQGGCYVDKSRVRISSRQVYLGQSIELVYSEQKSISEITQLEKKHILLINSDYIVINKPSGLLSQASRTQAKNHVLTALKKLLGDLGENSGNLKLVHRLDLETSGSMIIARNDKSSDFFCEIFKKRKIKKTYHLISHGICRQKNFEVKNYLSKINPKNGCVSSTSKEKGQEAITKFELLKKDLHTKLSYLAAQPQTGRTHQIRVHIKDMGHSILGDKKYGLKIPVKLSDEILSCASQQQFLHARSLEWLDPRTNKAVKIEAPYPEHWLKLLKICSFS